MTIGSLNLIGLLISLALLGVWLFAGTSAKATPWEGVLAITTICLPAILGWQIQLLGKNLVPGAPGGRNKAPPVVRKTCSNWPLLNRGEAPASQTKAAPLTESSTCKGIGNESGHVPLRRWNVLRSCVSFLVGAVVLGKMQNPLWLVLGLACVGATEAGGWVLGRRFSPPSGSVLHFRPRASRHLNRKGRSGRRSSLPTEMVPRRPTSLAVEHSQRQECGPFKKAAPKDTARGETPNETILGQFDGRPIQEIVRRRLPNGREEVLARVLVHFEPKDRESVAHIPFCLPFARIPEVKVVEVLGRPVRSRLAKVYPHGVAIELRREPPVDEEEWVTLVIRAEGVPLEV